MRAFQLLALALGSLLPSTLSTPPDTTPPPFPPTPAAHPRLYFSTADLPAIRANAQAPYLQSVLRQYEDALNHKLNYSAGGQLMDVKGVPGTRLQLAAALYVADHGPNATQWGEYAKSQVLARVSQILKDAGGGFGGGWCVRCRQHRSYTVPSGVRMRAGSRATSALSSSSSRPSTPPRRSLPRPSWRTPSARSPGAPST